MKGDMILVLNSDYTPLTVASVSRAFRLVYKEKAEIVVSKGYIKTERKDYEKPLIIRLHNHVTYPYKKATLSRYNLYRRDDYKCQYCGSEKNLTMDHIIPKSKGGKNNWLNLVTCCERCNKIKGDRTPEEANMFLIKKPFAPNHLFFINRMHKMHDEWKPYLNKSKNEQTSI